VFTLEFEDETPPIAVERLQAWVKRAGGWVADYYGGRFPVPGLEITIAESDDPGVGFGQHWDGRWLKIWVGRGTTDAQLDDDWVLVHELLHACFPDLPEQQRWMQEGLSTYLEPIVRVRAGNMTEQALWADWVRAMPQGRPRRGDRGLDRTHTWGRTYWGGALFWLMVDIELRRRRDDVAGLRKALRGIVARGGTGRADWPVSRVVAAGDVSTETTVFTDLYASMARAPGDVELPALWRDLGVRPRTDNGVRFDDTAPLAKIRRAMTT